MTDTLWTATHARASDPATSREAAASVAAKAATQTDEAVALVRRLPGQTAGELAQACGRQSYELHKRLSDGRTGLRLTNGPDRICTVEGTKQQTWYATTDKETT